ncbi:MAG: homoserine dehydrogenase [Stenotrophomonas sp.]|nr:homoserine dehydrogenase [Xanthomonadales bacterium]MBN8769214.1 homoserine dehydrogenase [Stenotrophomonas sp.]
MNVCAGAFPLSEPAPARVALLGSGTVGRAVWARLAGWQGSAFARRLPLAYVANSRTAIGAPAVIAGDLQRRLQASARASRLEDVEQALGSAGIRIVIDATASEAVADRHAHWLAQGLHVVTACKLGQGTTLARWRAIQQAAAAGGALYGDSATVGAGLPLLRTLRALQAGGDRIHAIAGVLSGSLAWLFHHYDGLRPFSGFVRQAQAAGYTEPDPREDLSGEDVRRKLLILARAAGVALEAADVRVQSLVPEALAGASRVALDAALPVLDAPLRARYAAAYKSGQVLRFIARLHADGRATVGLEALDADDPLAGGSGTDNRVAIWCDRYPHQPLVVQGPGAGAEVTAAALLDDALAIQAACAYDFTPKNSAIGSGRWNANPWA